MHDVIRLLEILLSNSFGETIYFQAAVEDTLNQADYLSCDEFNQYLDGMVTTLKLFRPELFNG